MDLQTIFTEAIELHTKGRYSEAKNKYVDILTALPDNISVLGNLGIVCRDLHQLDEAISYCQRAVDIAPDDPTQHINLGAVFEAKADLPQAKNCYKAALQILPTHPKALNNLGKIYHIEGNSEKALTYLEKALSVEPNYPLALNNVGVILSERGDVRSAIPYLEKSYSLESQNPETLYNLAGLYNCLDQHEQAAEMLQLLLDLDPEHKLAQHMLAAVTEKTTDMAPGEYVAETFDRYANRFDEHLQGKLEYTAPSVLADMLSKTAAGRFFQSTLDLGCGTGLSGQAFRHLCGSLTGVDISSKMLAKAEEKSIYDRLQCEEIYGFLKKNRGKYDLFLAIDVFIYLGRLDVFFSAIGQVAQKDAIVACSIEQHDGAEDFVLRKSGRYAHSPGYLLAMAKDSGFASLCGQAHVIRKEDKVSIPGMLYILQGQ